MIDDLKAMAAAAKKNGTPLVAWSPYRSYKQQKSLFNGYAGWNSKTQTYSNFDSAITYSARPGHSEHQTGLTIDFVAVGDKGLTSNWEVTRTGGWMAKNAWKYGWVMSYPKGKQDLVCYSYEPWHYRYFGRDLATEDPRLRPDAPRVPVGELHAARRVIPAGAGGDRCAAHGAQLERDRLPAIEPAGRALRRGEPVCSGRQPRPDIGAVIAHRHLVRVRSGGGRRARAARRGVHRPGVLRPRCAPSTVTLTLPDGSGTASRNRRQTQISDRDLHSMQVADRE